MIRDKLEKGFLVECQPYYTSPLHRLIGVDDTKGKYSLENIGKNGKNLTIAVLSMNRSSLTIRLMESIRTFITDFQGVFLIGDNGSADAEKENLKSAMKRMPYNCKMIEFDQNYGVAGGRNRIFDKVETDWIMSLDNDLYFTSNPLQQIQSDINALGVKFLALPLLDQDKRENGIYGGHLFVENLENRTCVSIGSTFYCKGAEMDKPSLGFLCTGVPGTAILNKETFFSVGAFDDNMFVGFEDTEFSVRVFQQGYKVGCCGMISLIHDHPKPEKKADELYEKKRFSNEKLYEAAMHFEKKSGFGVWHEGVANWVRERQKETGQSNVDEMGKAKIALVIDQPDWALDHIAKEMIDNLSDFFCFKRIYLTDINNLADVFILAEECQVIHFLWRGILTAYGDSYTQGRIRALGFSGEQFRERFIEGKSISTEVYDHLFLDDKENEVTTMLFKNSNSLLTHYAVSSKKIEKIYNELPHLRLRPTAYLPDGVNLNVFKPQNLERFNSIETRTVNIGWVGNSKWIIDDLKGINTIIKPAIDIIKSEGYDVNLVMSDRDNGLIPHYKMPQFYSKIDCYVCASLHEGTPNPILEAMACGIPVISTDVGVASECFGNLQKNYILKERTIEALVERLRHLMLNRDQFKCLSQENLEVIKDWDWKIQTQKVKKYFDLCIKMNNAQKDSKGLFINDKSL